MSQERRTSKADPAGNIARGAKAVAAWNAGDFDGFISYYHEHVVAHHPPGWPEPGPSFGIEAFREQFRRIFDAGFGVGGGGLERVTEPLAIGDRVISRTRSPMEVEGDEMVTELTAVSTWRDGKVIVVEYFWDHDEALEAVGLSERAMSQEIVEIVHGLAAAVGQRDLAFFLEVTDPAVEWHASVAVIAEGGAYHGHEGVRQYLSDIEEAFDKFDTTVEQVLTVGQVVLGVGHVAYRGKASGVEQTEPFGWVIRLREGQVVYLRAFRKPDEALAAVGLSE